MAASPQASLATPCTRERLVTSPPRPPRRAPLLSPRTRGARTVQLDDLALCIRECAERLPDRAPSLHRQRGLLGGQGRSRRRGIRLRLLGVPTPPPLLLTPKIRSDGEEPRRDGTAGAIGEPRRVDAHPERLNSSSAVMGSRARARYPKSRSLHRSYSRSRAAVSPRTYASISASSEGDSCRSAQDVTLSIRPRVRSWICRTTECVASSCRATVCGHGRSRG